MLLDEWVVGNDVGKMVRHHSYSWLWAIGIGKSAFIEEPDDTRLMEGNTEHMAISTGQPKISSNSASVPAQVEHIAIGSIKGNACFNGSVCRHLGLLAIFPVDQCRVSLLNHCFNCITRA